MSEIHEGMDVGYVAKLACVDLTDEETKLFQGQLDQILHYVEQLNELDVKDVEPTAHAIPVYNVLREDEVGTSLNHQDVMANAPASTDGQIRVPKIIDQ
ncbi:MAG: Asp-tRNA(Asn)/Glu-tRNA(Gln) amidotransferase subunit GatC [Kiritimatiellales bacterium]|nr:Asp-tRNA(Asn)/Glu-tRNA(Gln) amidotransferase subunit GatC [Pontiella sp.]NNJ70851.1 Asp-tRNA(Asn)/Glu-tRNA(Gln) amidotransferase subunit GatC [Kiritimatiellales bacterium]